MLTGELMLTHKWIILVVTLYYCLGNAQEDTDRCFTKLTLDDMGSHEITSTDATDSLSNTSCIRMWQIDVKKYLDNMTILLDFDVDMTNTDNCTPNYVKAISNSSVMTTHQELVVLCSQRQMQYEFYIDSILVLFKTTPDQPQMNQNFRLGYRLQTESTCRQTLSGSVGLATSPLYPDPYPRNLASEIYEDFTFPEVKSLFCKPKISHKFTYSKHRFQRCTYLFESHSVSTVMQLDFLHVDMNDNCLHEYLLVYGGTTENGHFVGRYCGYQLRRPKFKEFYKNFLVVFVSSDNTAGRTGFQARYDEVPCGGDLDVRVHESKLKFPGYSYPFSHNIRCNWSLITGYELHKVLLIFNDVDFDCSKTRITVHDEKRRNTTNLLFCEHSQQMYLSSGSKITVSLSNIENTVYFVMHYRSELIPACGDRQDLTSYEYAQTLQSPEYPVRYPDYMNCVWVIRTAAKENWIKVTVEEIDLESSCKDKLLFFNGDVYQFQRQPDITYECGHYGLLTSPFVSEGNTVTILFYSDARNVGKGFRIYYQSVSTDYEVIKVPTHKTNTEVFIGVVVAVIVVVVIIIIVMVVMIRKRRSAPEPQSSNHVYTHSRDTSVPSLVGMRGSISAPPPSYQEVSTHLRDENGIRGPPPPDTSETPPAYPRDETGGQDSEQRDTSATPSAPPPDASLPPTYSEAMLNNMIQVEWF